ncbi:MAG TPA: hypothetical protein RMH99_14075 [Sandaracinaceae bacterium LLY-WYZ-13_1]|nr:hypothetical protein [Sandaracinaceae bacterium LLY-WYZ-13_1]
MGLIKTRPRVRVRVPNEIRPGDRFLATVQLDCKRTVEVDFVDVVLEGSEQWRTGGGEHSTTRRWTPIHLAARLCGAKTLPAGETALQVRIPLPPDAPPSYAGNAARIDYALRVHASVPWWPDRRAGFEIHVAPNERPSPATEPRIYSSDPNGPRGREAHVELSLSSTWTRVGDVVSGAFALSNVEHNRYSEVKVGLVGTEVLYDGGRVRTTREYMRYQVRLGAEQASEGEMIPFRFRLPDDAMAELGVTPRPGRVQGLCSLHWELELAVGIRWAQDMTIRVPFTVLPRSARPGDAPERLAPPTVGSDRLRSIWEGVGEQRGLRYDAQTLWTRVGETTLVIRRDHMGRGGIFVVAELRYPALHLDLEVEPATSVQKMVGAGARIGDPSWDRDHYVLARDEAQVAEVLRTLVPRMHNASLRRMDDERLVVEVRDSGQSRARMERFAGAAMDLAAAIEELRQALPAPPAMAEAVPTWRDLATRLGAVLETARMRIEGRVGTLPAEIRMAFDEQGQPLHAWLAVSPLSPLDDEHAFHWTEGARDLASELAARYEGEVHELMRIVATEAREIEIEPARVAVCLPTPVGLDGGLDAAQTEQRLSRMARLVTLLRGQAGPYR